MIWRNWFKRESGKQAEAALITVRKRFATFLALLDANNRALAVLSDLEEKAQGDYLFDINYIRSQVSVLREGVAEVIDAMISLGGKPYGGLWECFTRVDSQLESILSVSRPIPEDEHTLPLDEITKEKIGSVGSKNAQLGELKSRLGLVVPDGFAVSAWAYKHFIDSNSLQQRLQDLIESLDIKRYEDLVAVSERIRKLVLWSTVPRDLSDAIVEGVDELTRRSGAERFAVRSSAIGENTHFSFAGQYSTFLNVSMDQVVERYREVIASKFTPKAIYYLLSHSFRDVDLAMSVGCMAMVDAVASGVAYSRDPLHPEDDTLLVNSVLGLGPYLVDGTLTPDVFRISHGDLRVVESHIEPKHKKLELAQADGVKSVSVAASERDLPSIDEAALKRLARTIHRIEAHYGEPQDVEWSLDRSGELVILQTRPLRLVRSRVSVEPPPVDDLEIVLRGGTTVCPGAGSGRVFHAGSPADIPAVPDGCVLVARHPFPGLITVLTRAAALVTEVGGVASHMATLAREYGIPTIMGLTGATGVGAGTPVTVDANSVTIYHGIHPRLVEARRADIGLLRDTEIIDLLRKVLKLVSPLNLLHPAGANFTVESCSTFHDITRFAHQKGVQEMFEGTMALTDRRCPGLRMKSDIPLPMDVFFLDRESALCAGGVIDEADVASKPMQAFWGGLKREGWPSRKRPKHLKTFMPAAGDRSRFAQESCVFLSDEYMVMSLRMGYHYLTVEAMCSSEPSKNYVGLQYKQGGMWADRRLRRVKLITDILNRVGFENSTKGDFLDSRISYLDEAAVKDQLHLLGRLTILTKQLDMALASDEVAQWYTQDILKKLGIDEGEEDRP